MDRSAAIRHHLRDMDPVRARRYATLATRWEQIRLATYRGTTNPGDDFRYQELSSALKVLSQELGLRTADVDNGDAVGGITDAAGYLPKDPSRLWCESWIEAAEDWYGAAGS
jgi:hypothetical protein